MNWTQTKSALNTAMSSYSSQVCLALRAGQYKPNSHYRDGMVAMIYETIMELDIEDNFYPVEKSGAQNLIAGFNKLTGKSVRNAFTNEESVATPPIVDGGESDSIPIPPTYCITDGGNASSF